MCGRFSVNIDYEEITGNKLNAYEFFVTAPFYCTKLTIADL